MVTRKPVGPPLETAAVAQQASEKSLPPYPTTPPPIEPGTADADGNRVYSPDLRSSPAFDLIDMHEAQQQRPRSDSDASSHGTWDSDDEEDQERKAADETDIPKPLNVKSSPKPEAMKQEHPTILLPGSSAELRPTTSLEAQKYDDDATGNPWAGTVKQDQAQTTWQPATNNPYHMRNNGGLDNSQTAWQDNLPTRDPPPVPTAAPPPPPPPQPAQDAPISPPESTTGSVPSRPIDDQRRASWETAERFSVPQVGQSPLPPVVQEQEETQLPTQRPTSRWWENTSGQQGETSEAIRPPAGPPPLPPIQSLELGEPKYQPPPGPPPQSPEASEPSYQPPPGPPPRRLGLPIDHENDPREPATPTAAAPETPRPIPSPASDSVPETPRTQARRQRNEHYQIKHVNWYDQSSSDHGMRSGMRRSPILTQNANGPCPLLALVNALVLSTPQNVDTALVETLRTREQVSLGLLLDAVFDELMSGRRGDTAHELPDVSELYSFLLALHTGMNVNPRFVTPARTPRGSFDGHPDALNGIHPLHRAQSKAGAFEETREMRLYSTFNVPLIHGWTPSVDTPAYEAFVRSAQTFEDAQNIQFAEMELMDKMAAEGLTPQESQTLDDIQAIKSFLSAWPTQLTEFGLETISRNLQPGQVAILFRNDHFSTVYKEPRHGALMTLVTDAGYQSHEEIVWESLVDVNGSASELFAGDFRVVSHNQGDHLNTDNSGGGNEGWETVQSRNRNRNNRPTNESTTSAEPAPPPLPGPRPPSYRTNPSAAPSVNDSQDPSLQPSTSEQEDHDLALALQLQEEEDDRQRQAEERRRREQELSEQFLANEPEETPRPPIPPRRSTNGRNGRRTSSNTTNNNNNNRPGIAQSRTSPPVTTGRPGVSRPVDPSDPEAPPSYEQAASDRPYRPAGSTAPASLSQGNPLNVYDALRRQQQASSSSTTTLNEGADTPPEYAARRQRAESNRLRRRSNQFGGPNMYPGSPSASPGAGPPGGYPYGSASPAQSRIDQAAGLREVDDGRCAIM